MKNPLAPFWFSLATLAFTVSITASAAQPADKKAADPKFVYEQRPIGASQQLVSPAVAAETISRFRAAYPKLGNPRILIYVNRELVDVRTGLKLAGREETVVSSKREAVRDLQPSSEGDSGAPGTETTSASTNNAGGTTDSAPSKAAVSSTEKKVANVNKYERTEREDDSFEYKQMVRDVELVFGRRLRSGGASLADQRIATQLMADRPLRDFTTPTEGEQARKDREALAKVADVVLEILIANRDVTVSKVSGNVSRNVPDLQVTAIRISDSKIIGQASAADVLGQKAQLNYVSNTFTTRDIADATALFLMEDMMIGTQP